MASYLVFDGYVQTQRTNGDVGYEITVVYVFDMCLYVWLWSLYES